MKKVFSIFLMLTLVLTMIPSDFAVAEEVLCYDADDMAYKAEILSALGLTDENITAEKLNSYVTNSELACVISNMLGFSRTGGFASEIPYEDVGADAPYYAKVKFAYANGYLPKADNFYPDMNAVSDDAVKSLVKMLGYEEVADNYGSIWICGAKIGLVKGNVPQVKSYFKWYQFIELIHNALDIDIMDESGYSNGDIVYTIRKDYGILGRYHNLYEFEGIVSANEYTSIEVGEAEVSEGFVKIGSETIATGETKIKDLLGFNTFGYVREESGKYTAVYADVSENKTVTVNAGNLLSDSPLWSAANIVYEDEKGNEKSLRLSRDTKVIYNGKLYSDAVANDYKINSGFITAINNDSDSDYDVVKVNSYQNIIVQSYDSFDEKVYCKTGTMVDINENRVSIDIRSLADEPYNLKYLGQNTIMSLAISKDSKLVLGYAVKAKASGVVTEIQSGIDGVEAVVLGGDLYKVSKQWNSMNYTGKPELKIGKRYLCYLDCNGEIAHAIDKSGGECEYGYLYKFGKGKGIDVTYKFRIFTQDNEWENFSASEKIKINGNTFKNDSDFDIFRNQDGSTKEQLIKFFLDTDGNIKSIYTNDRSTVEEPVDYVRDEFVYNGSVNARYRSNCSMFGLSYTLSGKSKVFYLPEIFVGGVTVKDTDHFEVMSGSSFTNDISYSVAVFDSDYYGNIGAGIVTSKGSGDWWDDGAVYVKSVNQKLSGGDETLSVSGYRYGAQVSLTAKDEEYISSLKSGDIIIPHIDKNGQIDSEPKMIFSAGDSFKMGEKYLFDTKNGYIDEGYVISGFAKALNSSTMVFDYGSTVRIPLGIAKNIMIYDTKARTKEQMFTKGSVNDIVIGDSINSASKIVIYYRKCVPEEIIIIK